MRFLFAILLFAGMLFAADLFAQQSEEVAYKKNSINTNITLCITNEINFGIERFITPRRSIEINGGIVYVNEFLEEAAKAWTNSHYFSEEGFTIRMAYKMYKKRAEGSRWTDYISPVLIYKYLFYDEKWFENEVDNSDYEECILQSRTRHKFGFEFLWGKVYELSPSTAFELYYGVGLRGTSVERTDIAKQDSCDVSPVYMVNWTDDNFYLRPSIHGGVKFRVNF